MNKLIFTIASRNPNSMGELSMRSRLIPELEINENGKIKPTLTSCNGNSSEVKTDLIKKLANEVSDSSK